VFVFYETEKGGLTADHLVYHGDALASTYALWKDKKTGFLFDLSVWRLSPCSSL
jgi:hypothetical protein